MGEIEKLAERLAGVRESGAVATGVIPPRTILSGDGDPAHVYVVVRPIHILGNTNIPHVPEGAIRPAFQRRWGRWRCAGHLLEEVRWPDTPRFRLGFRCVVCGKTWQPRRRRAQQRARREYERWASSRILEIVRKAMDCALPDPHVDVEQDPNDPTRYNVRMRVLPINRVFLTYSAPAAAATGPVRIPVDPNTSGSSRCS